MCNSSGRCETGYREELSESCPPERATSTSDERLYRLVSSDPPTDDDFLSVAELNPKAHQSRSLCERRALSVWTEIEWARHIRMAFPTHRDKRIALVTLPPDAGVIASDEQKPEHVRWWMCGAFDAVAFTVMTGE